MDPFERAERVADAFAALSNPLRVRILLALAGTRQPNWDHRGLSYGDLRAAVGVEDGGRFNYHLNELRGDYVVGDDGHYWLTATGARVVDDIYAGVFDESPEPREGPVERECWRCGAQLRVRVDEGLLTARCPDHGVVFDMPLGSPRAALNRDLEDLLAWADRRGMWYHESVAWDVCHHCGGSFGEATFDDEQSAEHPDQPDVYVDRTCDRCGIAFRMPVGTYAVIQPAAVAFASDHGLERITQAELRDAIGFPEVEMDGETARVLLQSDGDCLEIVIDRSLNVVETERRERRGEE